MLLSPFNAASATFALNFALWFLLGLFISAPSGIVSSLSTYASVLIFETGSIPSEPSASRSVRPPHALPRKNRQRKMRSIEMGSHRVAAPVEIRELTRGELSRVGEIDRTERIDALYEQRGTDLVERRGNWDSPAWDAAGLGEHSVHAQRRTLLHYADAGGVSRGAFSSGRLIGIGVVVPHIRPAIAQLAYLHVSRSARSTGVGSRLCTDLESIAVRAGDTGIVVSATPSGNTVRFYLGRGYRPMAQPLPELVALEPEDIHMAKVL